MENRSFLAFGKEFYATIQSLPDLHFSRSARGFLEGPAEENLLLTNFRPLLSEFIVRIFQGFFFDVYDDDILARKI